MLAAAECWEVPGYFDCEVMSYIDLTSELINAYMSFLSLGRFLYSDRLSRAVNVSSNLNSVNSYCVSDGTIDCIEITSTSEKSVDSTFEFESYLLMSYTKYCSTILCSVAISWIISKFCRRSIIVKSS